jgi:hypothetical protein
MTISYSLFKSKFKKSIAESIYNEVISGVSLYHHFLGKENTWTDFLSPFIPSSTTDVPGPPQDNFRYDLHVRRDILTTKKIKTSDIAYVAPRYDWQSGVVFDMYDDNIGPVSASGTTAPAYSGATRLEDARFYVLTESLNVYKCISNNYNAISTVQPTGTSIDVFQTADGYIWKFMYTIPLSLKNRFLSSDYIPVTTALKSQYYSGGQITNVTVDQGGANYLYEFIAGGNISSSTSSKTVTGTGTSFTSQIGPNYLIKKIDGTLIGIVDVVVSNTQITLKENALVTTIGISYKTRAAQIAYATVTGDGNLENNPLSISEIIITDGGDGYVTAPTITFSDPTVITVDSETATGETTIDGGAVDTTTLLTAGYGYGDAPAITVEPPIAGALDWVKNTLYAEDDIVEHNGIYYTVTTGGTTALIAPTHTTGIAANGTAQFTYSAKIAVLTPVTVVNHAIVDLVIVDGEITGVAIIDGGIGYTYANIEIFDTNHPNLTKLDGTNPDNAFLSINLDIGNINTLQANVELLAIPGTIECIKVVNGGTGYSTANVQIIGDGVGATATANMTAGIITSYTMTNVGAGYTWTNVVITGNGTGAVARAIMSPLKGHGRDAVDELNANSIMFYSAIARDTNQGLIVTNDYRKVGLLKNIRQFGSTNRFNEDEGSGCVLITGTFDKVKLQYDMLLVNSVDEYKNYRIVEFSDTEILVSVFNNFSINIFDTMLTPNGDQIFVTNVHERTIDQFSGELLFLSVREAFAPSDEQIITVRTVVTI